MSLFYLILALGGLAMLFAMLWANRQYKLPRWKLCVTAVLGTIICLYCTKLMYLLEYGQWFGVSYFGMVLFTPLVLMLLALLLRMRVRDMLDLFAPAECAMLFVQKLRCFVKGCCFGIKLYDSKTLTIRFPSQLVELVTGLVLMVILLKMAKNPKYRGALYGHYLLMYGCCRFVWQCFRGEQSAVFLILTRGHIWALLSIVIGGSWVLLHNKAWQKKQEDSHG